MGLLDRSGDRQQGTRNALRIVGAVLLILGAVIGIIGLSMQSAPSIEDEDWFARASSGIMMMFCGSSMAMFGAVLLAYGFLRKVTTYYAHEASPAIEEVSHAGGKGVTGVIRDAGGLKFDIHTSGPAFGGGSTREVVKVKCRSCGYLESEDAVFCSKCRDRM